jgi:hypothetical protein
MRPSRHRLERRAIYGDLADTERHGSGGRWRSIMSRLRDSRVIETRSD